MDLSYIKKIAVKARKDFESKKIDENELKWLYQQYNPIQDIDTFIKRAIEMFPKLNCGLATVYLRKIFGSGKIISGKYKDNNHTFLLLEESIVIDITSDQYGGPKVFVG